MSLIEDNIAFQKKYKFDQDKFDFKQLEFRVRTLLVEEFNETMSAFYTGDAEELVDGMIDMMVIILGTLSLAGVDIEEAWQEVFKANMSKIRGVKPGREHSGGVDVYKPEGWKAPSHVNNHGLLDEIFNDK